MGRPKRIKKKPPAPVYDSDDERAYTNERVPDKEDDQMYYDEVDEFHAKRDEILLDQGVTRQEGAASSDEDEVLAFESDDEDDAEFTEYDRQLSKFRIQQMDDEMASDIEGKEKDDDLRVPDDRAWGKLKDKFYGADVDDDEEADFSGSEPGDAELEEEEVKAIQKRMAEQLDDQDFGLDIFQPTQVKPTEDREVKEKLKIKKDLSKLSRREKLELLKKESPELLDLIGDYKEKMLELKDCLHPILQLIKSGQLPAGKAADYIQTKFKLLLTYCLNISFYLMLKAKQAPVHNHPVIGRLVQFRNLIKQLEPVDELMKNEIAGILDRLEKGDAIVVERRKERLQKGQTKGRTISKKEKRKLSQLLVEYSDEEEKSKVKSKKPKKDESKFETKDEREALLYYEMLKAGRKEEEGADEEGEENEGETLYEAEEFEDGGKRAISYQIEKNKGLTPHRKKEQRNPRVKHRMKYRKAKIRRRGQVREVRTEQHRYGGELSGIRAGIKRSVKLR